MFAFFVFISICWYYIGFWLYLIVFDSTSTCLYWVVFVCILLYLVVSGCILVGGWISRVGIGEWSRASHLFKFYLILLNRCLLTMA